MKRLKNILVFLMLIFLAAPNASIADTRWVSFGGHIKREKPSARVITSNDSETVIEFVIKGIEVEDVVEGNKTFQKLRFPGYFTSLQVGKPQLLVISELVGIPDIVNVKASIIDSEVTILKGYRIYPFQEPVLEGEKKAFIIDDAFYHEDSFYPEFDVKLSSPTIWRDIRIVSLKVFP